MSGDGTADRLSPELARRVRTVIEFHRWGGCPDGVTGSGTMYDTLHARARRDTLELEALLAEIHRHFRGRLPGEAETLLTAGRMYRRAADFVKAGEYFLRALETVQALASGEENA